MSDPRTTPDPAQIKRRATAQMTAPVTDLCRQANGPRDRQLLYGDAITVFGDEDGWSYVQAEKDGYCGYVPSGCHGVSTIPTHRVAAPATHAYAKPDLKSAERVSLSHGSRLTVSGESGSFAQTPLGFVPRVHLAPVTQVSDDPAQIAQLYLGTPYLWGGNSRWGIDCSGLVQAALLACGIPCPGDSDMQQALGGATNAPYQRNDLLFWKGHVALVTDADMLIHATAHAMAVTFEPIADAIARIDAQGDGPVTAHRRLSPLFGSINSPPEA